MKGRTALSASMMAKDKIRPAAVKIFLICSTMLEGNALDRFAPGRSVPDLLQAECPSKIRARASYRPRL